MNNLQPIVNIDDPATAPNGRVMLLFADGTTIESAGFVRTAKGELSLVIVGIDSIIAKSIRLVGYALPHNEEAATPKPVRPTGEVDYHFMCTIDTPKKERDKLGIGDVYRNEISCNSCGDVVRSKNRHHMAYCSCGKVAADGGSWYLRRVGTDYTELSQPFSDVGNSD